MNKRKKYFKKQKAFGVFVLLFAIVSIFILDGDATAALLFLPLALLLIFSKEMIMYDDYFFEVERKKNSKRLK